MSRDDAPRPGNLLSLRYSHKGNRTIFVNVRDKRRTLALA